MSTESELELRIAALDPQQFERLVYDLVRVEHPNAIHPRPPDSGADVFVAGTPDRRALVWQAKRYTRQISWSKCKISLVAAMAGYDPEIVTFVFPRDLSASELKTFHSRLVADRARVDLWTLSSLRARLQAVPSLRSRYFPALEAAVHPQDAPRFEWPATISGETGTRHVFISYVHEDASAVERLTRELESFGVEVWRDEDRLSPGMRWQTAIREAIEGGAFFIGCFSEHSVSRERSYMNEELTIAIDELRKRPSDRAWFLPVLLSPGTLPRRNIGAGETLKDLQYVDLYRDWEEGVRRLVSVIEPEAHESARARARRGRFKRPSKVTYRTDAAVYARRPMVVNLLDEIRRCIDMGLAIPADLLYSSSTGATNWLRLAGDPTYLRYQHAVEFWGNSGGQQIASIVRDQLGCNEFNYVSLGSGDGKKDADLLGYWLRSGADLVYYPYDCSSQLQLHAIRHTLDRTPLSASRRLTIKALIADFSDLDTMSQVFQQQSRPNVVALLGNSLGSSGREHDLLRMVREVMSSEDLLVLEVPLSSPKRSAHEPTSSEEAPFYFSALEALGLPFDESCVTVTTEMGLSTIPDTTTRVVAYGGVDLDGQHYDQIRLGYIHSYAERAFLNDLRRVGFKILESTAGGGSQGFLICVARRDSGQASD
jgi:hypothetical protein